MKEQILPIFTSHYSLTSILNLEKIKKGADGKFITEIKNDAPVSILSIVMKYGLERPVIVDKGMSSYWDIYAKFLEIDKQYIFGQRLCICSSAADKTEESKLTESNVILLFNDSQSYYRFVKWSTRASTTNFYDKPRLDWQELNTLMEENPDSFSLLIPMHGSFLHRNLTVFNASCFPRWGALKPTFLLYDHGLPHEGLTRRATEKYCEENKFNTILGHQIFAYRDEDSEALLTKRCISRRTTLSKPEQPFSSNSFTFESYLRKIGKTLQ